MWRREFIYLFFIYSWLTANEITVYNKKKATYIYMNKWKLSIKHNMKRNPRQNSCLFVNGSNLLSLGKSIKSPNWLPKSMGQFIKLTNQFYKSMYQFIKTSNRFNKSMDWFAMSSLWFKSLNNFSKAHQVLTSVQTGSWEKWFN